MDMNHRSSPFNRLLDYLIFRKRRDDIGTREALGCRVNIKIDVVEGCRKFGQVHKRRPVDPGQGRVMRVNSDVNG